ncbi:Xylose reductase [Kluyveromyces marxianus]
MTYLPPTVTLNNGSKMPLVGLGCWKIPNEVCAEQVYEAIKLGYRLFDGAQDYANEKEVGQGINRAIKEGIVKREDLVVVSKLWNSFHHPDNVRTAVERTLNDLQLDYLDLFYIHFPLAFKFVPLDEKYPPGFYTGKDNFAKEIIEEEPVPILDTYRALEKLVDEGLIKSLGISNFSGALIQDLLRGVRIKPVALQIEHHPYLVQDRLITYAQKVGLQVVAYSSFGPLSFVELNNEKALHTKTLFENDTIKAIAQKHNVTPSHVLLKWSTQRGIAVIPKSSKKERLLENLKIEETFTLSDEDIKEINGLDQGLRFNDPWDWLGNEFPTFI